MEIRWTDICTFYLESGPSHFTSRSRYSKGDAPTSFKTFWNVAFHDTKLVGSSSHDEKRQDIRFFLAMYLVIWSNPHSENYWSWMQILFLVSLFIRCWVFVGLVGCFVFCFCWGFFVSEKQDLVIQFVKQHLPKWKKTPPPHLVSLFVFEYS